MRLTLGTALTAALLIGANGASAQTLATLFPNISTEVGGRLGALTGKLTKAQKKEKSALTVASKAIAVETDDVAKTLADAVKACGAVEKTFAADPTLPGLFDAVVVNVLTIVTSRRQTLDDSIAALAGNRKQAAVQKAAAKADKTDAGFTVATTRTARLKSLQKKYAAIVSGEKVAAKAGAGVIATVSLDVDVERQHLHLPGLQPFVLSAEYVTAPPGTFRLRAVGGIGEARHTITIEVAAPGPGQHDVTTGPFSTYSVFSLAGPPGPPLQAVTGSTVNFTTWDPAHGKVAAKLTVTFSNSTSTVHLTNGSLVSMALQNQ